MLWAACCLGFFCFLRAGEFTANSASRPSIHMTGDLQADSLVNPTCLKFILSTRRLIRFAWAVITLPSFV